MPTANSVSLSDILTILSRRKRLLVLTGVTTSIIAFGVARVLPVQYSSEGSLLIDQARSSSSSDSDSNSSSVMTEVDVIQSKGLIRRMVSDLNLASTPDLIPSMRLPPPLAGYVAQVGEALSRVYKYIKGSHGNDDLTDAIVIYVQKHLTVESKEKSAVISVQFQAGSPDIAATVVNGLMNVYLSGVDAARVAQMAKSEQWISEQMTVRKQEVETAEQRVTGFVRAHNLSEVQGSLVTALQLSKDQEQLVLARQEYAKAQAALESVQHAGTVANSATIDDKSIQILKELDAKTSALLSTLTLTDPRRAALENQLGSIKTQLGNQKELVFASLSRELQIARARVDALEATVKSESETAQNSTVEGATLRQLTSDLDAKRQLYVAFVTQAGQMRIAAAQAPSSHLLFQGLPPDRPARSLGALSLVLGFFSGVLGVASIIMLRNTMSSKVNSTEEMVAATGLRAFGSLPDVPRRTRRHSTLYAFPPVAETFRAMWVSMRPQQNEGTTILITSSETGEGKTTVAMALAQRFAEDAFRVLLIDADLRHPRLSTMLEPGPHQCLEAALSHEVPIERAVLNVRTNLDCLLTRGGEKNPVWALSSPPFKQLLATCKMQYDFIVMDSPPSLHVADPVVLAKLCDHIVFVVQAGRLPTELVVEALRRFPDEERLKMAALLTRVRPSRMDGRGYYSGYATRDKL